MEPKEPRSAFSRLPLRFRADLPDILCLEAGADGRQRQLQLLQGPEASDSPAAPPLPLCAGRSAGPRVRGDGTTTVFHGRHRLGGYDANGRQLDDGEVAA